MVRQHVAAHMAAARSWSLGVMSDNLSDMLSIHSPNALSIWLPIRNVHPKVLPDDLSELTRHVDHEKLVAGLQGFGRHLDKPACLGKPAPIINVHGFFPPLTAGLSASRPKVSSY